MPIDKKKMCKDLLNKGQLKMEDKVSIIYKEELYTVTDLETGVLFETDDVVEAVDRAIRVYFNCKSPAELNAELNGREAQNELHFDKLRQLEEIQRNMKPKETSQFTGGFASLKQAQEMSFEIPIDSISQESLKELFGQVPKERIKGNKEGLDEMLSSFREEFDVDVSTFIPKEEDAIDILNDTCLSCVNLGKHYQEFVDTQKDIIEELLETLSNPACENAQVFLTCKGAVMLAAFLEQQDNLKYTTYRTKRNQGCHSLVCFKIERK